MFSIVKTYSPVVPPQGDFQPCAIEQFASKEFFENGNGWLRNDIAALAAATSKSQYDAIVQRLVERKAEYNLKDDVKLVDAFKTITPRWCQSPYEISQFAEYAAGLQLSDVDEQYKKVREKDLNAVVERNDDVSDDSGKSE